MSYPPVAIVWPCPVSVEVYVASGRGVVAPRLVCPTCRVAMGFWSGYQRSVRVGGACFRLWVARARCAPCGVSHALVPSFLLVGRLDVVATIGRVVEVMTAGGRGGVRPVATEMDVPHTTDWVRVFGAPAAVLWSGFAALSVELGGDTPTRWPPDMAAAAMTAMRCAHDAAEVRQPGLTPGLWGFVALVCGGMLIRANTDPPWTVFGKRRFIPPIPFTGP